VHIPGFDPRLLPRLSGRLPPPNQKGTRYPCPPLPFIGQLSGSTFMTFLFGKHSLSQSPFCFGRIRVHEACIKAVYSFWFFIRTPRPPTLLASLRLITLPGPRTFPGPSRWLQSPVKPPSSPFLFLCDCQNDLSALLPIPGGFPLFVLAPPNLFHGFQMNLGLPPRGPRPSYPIS